MNIGNKNFLGGMFPDINVGDEKTPRGNLKIYSVISKLGGIIGGISREKVYEGARGIGYRLGVLRDRISHWVLQGSSKEDEEWYPRKEVEIEKAKQLKAKYEADTSMYANRGH